MSNESARDFVNKFYEDEEFLKDFYKRKGFELKSDRTEESEYREIAEIAKQMGFDFEVQEFKDASKGYVNDVGKWQAFKKIFYLVKIRKIAKKEFDKELKNKNA